MKIVLLLLVFTAVLPARELTPEETRDLLVRLVEKRDRHSVRADFREEKFLALMKNPVVETGTLAFLPPDKFRREVPGRSLTVCDGKTLWLYYPEFNEVEKYALSSSRALRESLAALTSGLGLQDLARTYDVSARELADGHQLSLVPKTARLRRSVQRIVVDLSPAFSVRRLEILGGEGDRTVTTFLRERAAPLRDEDFQFHPPEGTTVSEPLG